MGLLTHEQLAAWRGSTAPETGTPAAAQWTLCLDAVESHWLNSDAFTVPDDWETDSAIVTALCMMANRLLKRPVSPEGVAGFADLGVVRISRFDPDIELLLSPHKKWNFA